jgi:hypothetical protein
MIPERLATEWLKIMQLQFMKSMMKLYLISVYLKNDFLLYLLGWLRREGIDIDHYCVVKIIEGLAYSQEKKR